MAQYFEIKKDSTLPSLQMELINDGKYDFLKNDLMFNAIQNADIYFYMKDENGILKISKSKCNLILNYDECCNNNFLIEYQWTEKDTRTSGVYEGWFEIYFKDDLYEHGVIYPNGKLIMPIHEKLIIHILQ